MALLTRVSAFVKVEVPMNFYREKQEYSCSEKKAHPLGP